MYNITPDHILHIHGLVASDDIIVGHNNYIAPNPEYGGNQWEMEEIEIIRVFGHSYNDIDIPYFQKIKDSVSKEIRQLLLKPEGLYVDGDYK